MSDKIDDGGCAFPCEQGHTPDGTWNQTFEPGVSLRDWFAGQALAGMRIGDCSDFDAEGAAEYAYRVANAMLAARKGENQ